MDDEPREVFRVVEDHRQRSLTKMLGQVTCGFNHEQWCDEPGKACPNCGAAV